MAVASCAVRVGRALLKFVFWAAMAGLFATAVNASPLDKVTPGELIIDPPTLINLGFEWVISGDDNHNAKVEVEYRRKGEAAWHPAMPLLRLHHEIVHAGKAFHVVMPNMFAGSVLDLQENTAYQVRLHMSDPDGGGATRIVTVKTRAEPQPAAGGHIYNVYPRGWKGPQEPGSFNDLMCAYNTVCGGGDTVTAGRPRVKPGDIIVIHAGVYRYHPEYYTGDRSINSTTPVEGTYYLTASGTPDRPIVIKAAGDGPVIFDGGGNFNLFNIKKANYTYFEGLTFRNTTIAIWAGTQFIAGSSGLTVKHCRFEDINIGIWSNWSGSDNFTILDNTFIGRNNPTHLMGWRDGEYWKQFVGIDGQQFQPKLLSYTAVRVYGQGHVMAYNYVANFHDGIDVETYGNPDGSDASNGPYYPPRQDWKRRPVAIDYYNNYMTNFEDNAFEIDGSMHNVRVMRNMILNSASHPLCNQPAIGGPIYWIRNIVYNAPFGSTRTDGGSPGMIFLNNTILSETNITGTSNSHWMNNLMLGQNSQPAIFFVSTYTNYSSSDYNGFRVNPGAAVSFVWNSPVWGAPPDYRDLLEGRGGNRGKESNKYLVTRHFTDLGAYSAETHQDVHSVLLDYDIFEHVPMLDAHLHAPNLGPEDARLAQKLYDAKDLDFRLKPGAAAVDRGAVIANVTDGFTGNAPDLGALEYGLPAPHYGPRS
jgi:hypothetical protein